MWKWFLKKIRGVLSSSPDYKLDFVIDNINKANTKILMNVKITVIMNSKQAPINISPSVIASFISLSVKSKAVKKIPITRCKGIT